MISRLFELIFNPMGIMDDAWRASRPSQDHAASVQAQSSRQPLPPRYPQKAHQLPFGRMLVQMHQEYQEYLESPLKGVIFWLIGWVVKAPVYLVYMASQVPRLAIAGLLFSTNYLLNFGSFRLMKFRHVSQKNREDGIYDDQNIETVAHNMRITFFAFLYAPWSNLKILFWNPRLSCFSRPWKAFVPVITRDGQQNTAFEIVEPPTWYKVLWFTTWLIRVPLALAFTLAALPFYTAWHIASCANMLVLGACTAIGSGLLILVNLPKYLRELKGEQWITSLCFSATAATITFVLLGFAVLPMAVAASVAFLYSFLAHRPGTPFFEGEGRGPARSLMAMFMLLAGFSTVCFTLGNISLPVLPAVLALSATTAGLLSAGIGFACVLVFAIVLPMLIQWVRGESIIQAADFYDQSNRRVMEAQQQDQAVVVNDWLLTLYWQAQESERGPPHGGGGAQP